MTDVAQPAEAGPARLVLTMTIAGMLAGLVLAGAYALTLPTIEANAAEALRRAVFQVVPGTKSMRELVLTGDHFVVADGKAAKDAVAVYACYADGGAFCGYAIPGQGPGFQDTIKLIYGYDPVRKVIVGLQVLESRETPGLGDRIYKDPAFGREFTALAVEPEVVVVKHGTKTQQHQVDGISGATISSKSVVRIVVTQNKALLDKLPVGDAYRKAPEGNR